MKIKHLVAIIYILVILIVLRLAELIGIAVQIPSQELPILLGLTLFGLLTDLVFFITIVLLLNLFFQNEGIPKTIHFVGMVIFHLLLFAHLVILVYYIHQRIPLGIILYQHNFDEVYLTATNSGYSMNYLVLILVAIIFLFIGIYFLIKKLCKSEWTFNSTRKVKIVTVLGLFYLLIESFIAIRSENYYVNNTKYFLSESIHYYWDKTHPMDLHYDKKQIATYQKSFRHNYIDNQFPLLHKTDTVNHLESYFEPFTERPNIVFLIVEGLNDDFIHEQSGITLMPYLNHLKSKSLYWKNCFTLGERSFAAVPSLLGSLIYGEAGFMQLNAYPRFTSMANILKANDYHVRFNYGQGAWFHSKDKFFKWQDVDVIFDKDVFDPNLSKILVDDGYFWGYDDITFLSESIKNLDKYPNQPSLEIYFTGSMHSPYIIPNKEKYLKALRSSIKNVTDPVYKAQLQAFEKYYVTTQVTDDAIQQFITSYSKRPAFENTLFIITGDHPMTEAPVRNSLKRYHVPLLFYSPKLKKAATSNNVVSHLDVQQTLYNILRNYGVEEPKSSVGLGSTLKVEGNDKNRSLVFMNGHRFLEDIYLNGYYLAKNQLYKVDEDFNISKTINIQQKKNLEEALSSFKWMSLFTSTQQRLLPAKEYVGSIKKSLIHHIKLPPIKKATHEFIDWLKDLPLTGDQTIEIYYNNTSKDPAIRVVLALNNQKGENYYYQEIYTKKGDKNSVKIPMTVQAAGDILKVYVFNPNQSPIQMEEIEVLLYQ